MKGISSDARLKILFLITGLNTGGAEILLLRHVEFLKAQGEFDVRVVTLSGSGELVDSFIRAGVPVYACRTRFKYSPCILYRVWRQIYLFKPNILHSHLFHANLVGRVIGKIAGVQKVISTIHNENFGGKVREWCIRHTNFLADKTVVISEQAMRVLSERHVIDEKYTQVIPNGVNVSDFKNVDKETVRKLRNALGVMERETLFIAVGRLREQKGYTYMLQAVEELTKTVPTFKVIVLGEGSLKEQIMDEIRGRKIEDRVFLLGNQSEVKNYMAASDAFIMTSLWEGLSIALLEAASAGLPLIVTDVGSNSEVVVDGKNGFLVPKADAISVANAMRDFIGLDTITRQEMSEYGISLVQRRFSEDKMFSDYDLLYRGTYANQSVRSIAP